MNLPDKVWLSAFKVSAPEHVAETAIANVWKVKQATGEAAALKVYNEPTMGNEAIGLGFVEALNGGVVVEVLAVQNNAVLLEWLPGPSLGDIVRAGNDELAAKELGLVARRLHKQVSETPISQFSDLPKLEEWFDDLFAVTIHADCAPDARSNMERCQDLARKLLATQTDVCPLHGDFHHDNIKHSEAGYRVFDAKGVWGERAYELANAFRNPIGAGKQICDQARALRLLDLWSNEFGVDRTRLMQWAAVKSALSICWRSGPIVKSEKEFEVLALFLNLLDSLPDQSCE